MTVPSSSGSEDPASHDAHRRPSATPVPRVRGMWGRLGRASLLFAMALLGYSVCIWVVSILSPPSSSAEGLWGHVLHHALAPATVTAEALSRDDPLVGRVLLLLAIHATASAFLCAPAVLRPAAPGARGRSLRLSLAGAALVAGTLTLGALGLVLDVAGLVTGSGSVSAAVVVLDPTWLPCLIA